MFFPVSIIIYNIISLSLPPSFPPSPFPSPSPSPLQVRGAATVASGAYLCECDKLEQLLDLVRDAVTNMGLQLNREIYALVNVGGEGMYDEVSQAHITDDALRNAMVHYSMSSLIPPCMFPHLMISYYGAQYGIRLLLSFRSTLLAIWKKITFYQIVL